MQQVIISLVKGVDLLLLVLLDYETKSTDCDVTRFRCTLKCIPKRTEKTCLHHYWDAKCKIGISVSKKFVALLLR